MNDAVEPNCPLVLIEWEDSARPVAEWRFLRDYRDGFEIVRCCSVDWLIHDGPDVKALAPNMGDLDAGEHVQASGVIRIPARAVTRIVPLVEVEPAVLTEAAE